MREGEPPYLLVSRAQWETGSSLKDGNSNKDGSLHRVGRGGHFWNLSPTQILGLALHPVR